MWFGWRGIGLILATLFAAILYRMIRACDESSHIPKYTNSVIRGIESRNRFYAEENRVLLIFDGERFRRRPYPVKICTYCERGGEVVNHTFIWRLFTAKVFARRCRWCMDDSEQNWYVERRRKARDLFDHYVASEWPTTWD